MNTKKFPFLLSLPLFITLCVLGAAQIAFVIINLSRIFNWFSLFSRNLVYEICQIALSVIIFFVCALLLNTRYVISDGRIKVKAWFLNLSGGGIEISKIIKIVYKKAENKLFLNYYVSGSEDAHIANVCCGKENFENFAAELQQQNPRIEYLLG